jgi:immunoglobulin-binding protein 1
MKIFEDATRLTSIAGIFSSNECLEEVATDNVRLFLLPALLGTLALKLTVSNRMEVVEMSDVYFRDFLQRYNFRFLPYYSPNIILNKWGC